MLIYRVIRKIFLPNCSAKDSFWQLWRKLLFSLLVGSFGYFLFDIKVININLTDITVWPNLMYLTVAVGLYLNVMDIDLNGISSQWKTLASILIFGIPLKILLPGVILGFLRPDLWSIVFLCSTVIAQIDPIAAAYNLKSMKLSAKTKNILRFWSSFDDPISVLFAFYIFLPLTLESSSFSLVEYILNLFRELLVCGIILFFYRKFQHRTRLFKDSIINFFDLIFVFIIVLLCGLSGSFLTPAVIGLIIRPKISPEIQNYILQFIFYFSIFNIGALASSLEMNSSYLFLGILLGFSMFFIAQPIVTMLFVRDITKRDQLRLMFSHENGMTAVLLTVAIELRSKDIHLLPITLPAIVCIAFFYLVVNTCFAQKDKTLSH